MQPPGPSDYLDGCVSSNVSDGFPIAAMQTETSLNSGAKPWTGNLRAHQIKMFGSDLCEVHLSLRL